MSFKCFKTGAELLLRIGGIIVDFASAIAYPWSFVVGPDGTCTWTGILGDGFEGDKGDPTEDVNPFAGIFVAGNGGGGQDFPSDTPERMIFSMLEIHTVARERRRKVKKLFGGICDV